jgi:hypothetical protein
MAAGQGFKTFATGDVLSASDVNGYLMQGVLVFADATERNAEITSPQEGQFAYLKDTNVTTYYTGSAWANLDTTGMTNPMTTTGDTIYSSSGSTPARLGIGSTGQVLTVSGGVPTWASAASGGSMTLISSTALSGSSVSFTSITGSYKNLYIHLSNPYASSAGGYKLTFNNDTGSTMYHYFYTEPDSANNYPNAISWWSFLQGNWGFNSAGVGAASNGNAFHLWVYDYAGGTKKAFNGIGVAQQSDGDSQLFPTVNGNYRSNTAITRVDLIPNAGTWSGGTAYLYGVN